MPKETLAPVDESIVVPEVVRRAAAAADEIHRQAYPAQTPPPAAIPPVPPVVDPAVVADPAVAPAVDPAVAPLPVVTDPVTSPPVAADAQVPDWEGRYNSMKGRYEQGQRTLGSMQEQMSELGNELGRTQTLLNQPRSQPKPPPAPLLTDEDRAAYGPELVDMVQRAAREAVSPDLTAVQQQNNQLRQQLTHQAQAGVYQNLDQEIPHWRDINSGERFKAWCRLPDLYSGVVRGKLLNDAFRAANSPRVLQFFRGFLAEEVATGQQPAPLPSPAPAARTAAVPLETLAAPGRANPASGQSSAVPADKPTYTRAEVKGFYDNVRKGVYAGRDADRARDEALIFAAQRDGRIR